MWVEFLRRVYLHGGQRNKKKQCMPNAWDCTALSKGRPLFFCPSFLVLFLSFLFRFLRTLWILKLFSQVTTFLFICFSTYLFILLFSNVLVFCLGCCILPAFLAVVFSLFSRFLSWLNSSFKQNYLLIMKTFKSINLN